MGVKKQWKQETTNSLFLPALGFFTENQKDVCIHKEKNYVELIDVVMEASKSKICRVGQQARDPGKLMSPFQSEGCLLGDSFLPGGCQSSVQISVDPIRPTHITDNNVFLKIHQFKC